VLPSNTIPHNADPYVTANFRRRCVELYSEFYKENPRSLLGSYYPEQIVEEGRYFEGAVERVLVNRYERNKAARQECIDHYGTTCAVCDFDFEAAYGLLGKGYSHVHHLLELSSIGESYEVDPIQDLRPVCPNCHAMLHRKRPAYSIEELQLRMVGK
jgi:5-methylcytosine-specific restriction protein A